MNSSEEFKVGKHGIGYISSSFDSRFPAQNFEISAVAPRPIVLPRYMTDAQIESELKPSICTLGDVIAVLDSADPVFKDGNWNLFYFPSCVVRVGWHGSGWGVRAWGRGGRGWGDGYRVFSPASDRSLESSDPSLTLETLAIRVAKLESLINPELLK